MQKKISLLFVGCGITPECNNPVDKLCDFAWILICYMTIGWREGNFYIYKKLYDVTIYIYIYVVDEDCIRWVL